MSDSLREYPLRRFHSANHIARMKHNDAFTRLRVTDYPANGAMAPHSHEEPSLIVVAAGTYLERIDGTEAEQRRGSMLLYPAGAVHSQRFGPRGVCKIVFSPDASCLEYLREHNVALDRPRSLKLEGTTYLAERVIAESRRTDAFAPVALEGLAMELVAAFARWNESPRRRAAPGWIASVRDAVEDAATDAPSLAALGEMVGKHPVQVAREFRRQFGVSIGEFRRRRRLERAVELLQSRIPLTEIAFMCGFASQSHFCRAFKAAYGVTPSQRRRG
jgi:AraC family transcriptional regulator